MRTGGFLAGKKMAGSEIVFAAVKKRSTRECKIQQTRKLTQQNSTASNTGSPLTRDDQNTRQQTSLCSLKQTAKAKLQQQKGLALGNYQQMLP